MNLDSPVGFSKIDKEGMLTYIDQLPEQLAEAWKLGRSLDLPKMEEIHNVVIAGMGSSAIGADLLAAAFTDRCPVPIFVHRDYSLPAWAKGQCTLAVLVSHSGGTEETLSAFDRAVQCHCQIVTITAGGKLLEEAQKMGLPAWKYSHIGPPNTAIGFSFGLLLALFTRLGLIPDQEEAVAAAVSSMQEQRKSIAADVPLARNPAKRLAGQLVGRCPTFFGAGLLSPAARRWKCQINEVAKSLAAFETLPDCDHNTLAGLAFPENVLDKAFAFFLRSESDPPRTALRFDLTQQIMLEEGINTDSYLAAGKTPLEQLWRAVQFGDCVSYYLAMANEIDPAESPTIQEFQQSLPD
jgi:glucose/mannose-6-phosphate isomerase